MLTVRTEILQTETLAFSPAKHVLIPQADIWTYFNFIIFLPGNNLNEALENIRPKGGRKNQSMEGVSFYFQIWSDWSYN